MPLDNTKWLLQKAKFLGKHGHSDRHVVIPSLANF